MVAVSLLRPSVSVPGSALAAALGADLDVVRWDLDGPPPRSLLDLVVLPYQQDPALARAVRAVDCSLVQTQTIGYEDVLPHLPEGVRVANAASVHEASTAELALALTLASLRRLPDYVRAAGAGRWRQEPGRPSPVAPSPSSGTEASAGRSPRASPPSTQT